MVLVGPEEGIQTWDPHDQEGSFRAPSGVCSGRLDRDILQDECADLAQCRE
jgi:hypothetical protein